jgi:hypothetical protein
MITLELLKNIVDLKSLGKNYREIAILQNIPNGTVSSLLSEYKRFMATGNCKSYRRLFIQLENNHYVAKAENNLTVDIKSPIMLDLDECLQLLKESIVATVEKEVKVSREEFEKLKTENGVLTKENKLMHDKIEAIQAQSVLGMLRTRLSGS